MSSEPMQIMSTPYPLTSIFQKMFEDDVIRSMSVPQEYLKYNEKKELPEVEYLEYQYLTCKNIIFDPIAVEIYWRGVRDKLKTKIANSNATTFLEVNDGD